MPERLRCGVADLIRRQPIPGQRETYEEKIATIHVNRGATK